MENAFGVSPFALNFIKKLEGYTPKPKWDFKQYSTGYGTRWEPGQPIGTKADHEAALASEAGKVNAWLGQNVKAPMTENQRAALISAGFNLGTGEKGLGRLLGDIQSGNWDSIARRLPSFNKAGGQVNEGLINRRAAEVEMLTGRKPTQQELMASGYIGGTAATPSAGPSPMPAQLPEQPSARKSKLADMLMAKALSSRPQGWGDALNSLTAAFVGSQLGSKHDDAEKGYRSKLAEALMGAKDNDALVNTMLSSGDPDLQSAAVNLKVAQMKPKAAEVGRFKVENGAVIDTATGQIVAGELQQKGDGIQRVSPGETLFDPRTGKPIYTADQKPQGPQTVSPGQVIVDPATGREIYSAPEKEQGPVTVSPGQRLVDPKTGIDLYAAPDKPQGLQEVSPGATLFDPNTQKPVFTAQPKPENPLEGAKFEQGLRKEFTDLSKDYRQIKDGLARLQVGSSLDSGAGDIAMVYGYMKLLDPGSVVREGEFATAEQTAGVPEQVRSVYNRLLTGQRLTPTQKQQFLTAANGLTGTKKQEQQRIEQRFRDIATKAGVDPNNIMMEFGGSVAPETPPPSPAGEVDPRAIDLLRSDPSSQRIQQFEQVFGPGSAQQYLGR